MPFALILIGAIAVVTAVRGTQTDFFNLIKGDLAGANNFFYWLVAIVGIGALGYIPRVRPISDAFLVLIVIVLFLAHKGFFGQFQQVVERTSGATTSNSPHNAGTLGGISGPLNIPPV